jgi:hypothetical protein
MTIACLPSLRPIYRIVINRSLKDIQSPQKSAYPSAAMGGKSNNQTLAVFKNIYSDSTKHLAIIDGDGNRIFTEARVDASGRSTEGTGESDSISLHGNTGNRGSAGQVA